MTVVAALEAVALVATVFLFLRHARQSEDAWTAERRELLTRVAHPEHVPAPAVASFSFEPEDADELALVGTIADPPEPKP